MNLFSWMRSPRTDQSQRSNVYEATRLNGNATAHLGDRYENHIYNYYITQQGPVVHNEREVPHEDGKVTIDALRKNLYVNRTMLRTVQLDAPRLVCNGAGCVEHKDDGTGTGVEYAVHSKPCHDPCYLEYVQRDKMADPALLQCYTFNCGEKETCACCGHSYKSHMQVVYSVETYTVRVKDLSIQQQIDKLLKDDS